MTVSRSLARRTLLGGLTVVCLVGAAGCGSSSSEASGGSPTAQASQGGDTRTVTDAKGTQVQVPANPSRVVVTHYAGTQAALDLGLKPVGSGPAGQAGDDGEDYVPAHLWSQLKDVPVITRGPEVDVEAVAAQEPDLILATNVTEDDVLAQLRKIAPVYQFTLRGGERKDWQSRVGEVADALNRTPQFDKLRTDWDGELKAAATKYADVTKGVTTSVIGAYEQGNFYAWGQGNMQGTILLPLGFTWSKATNAAVAGEKEPEATLSNEKILTTVQDADMLFIDTNVKDAPNSFMQALQKTSLYQQVPAVKKKHVYPFGKNTIAGFSDARFSLGQITKALDDYKTTATK